MPEVVQVRVEGSLEDPEILGVEPDPARLVEPVDDELRIPGRPVRVGVAELLLVDAVGRLRFAQLGRQLLCRDCHRVLPPPYIRKMPNVLSGTGAFSAAEIPSASTRRVSRGSMIPSSQSRAVE